MDTFEQSRFNVLYQSYLNELTLQGKYSLAGATS